MLAICEDCAKRYNINETRIKGATARFSCQECGHIIVVHKPAHLIDNSKEEETIENISPELISATALEKPGTQPGTWQRLPIASYLLLALSVGFLLAGSLFAYLSLWFIPSLIKHQAGLHGVALSTSFAEVIREPLKAQDFPTLHMLTEKTSNFPGVAYAAIVQNNLVLAGSFHDAQRFSTEFAQTVNKDGFPLTILKKNQLPAGKKDQDAFISVQGKKIFDRVVALDGELGTAHIGIFLDEIYPDGNFFQSSFFVVLFLIILAGGILIFIIIARFITKPLHELTGIVQRISLGEFDCTITPQGPKEVRELATAFERMRSSLKSALERLQQE